MVFSFYARAILTGPKFLLFLYSMESIKAYFLIFIFLGAMGFGAYWGFTSLKKTSYDLAYIDEVTTVSEEDDASPIVVTAPEFNEGEVLSGESSNEEESEPEEENSSSSEYSDLISDLQKLVDDNVLMKNGSRGTRVGIVQEFLNIYNGTDSKVDNDYGGTTETLVKKFQSENGLTSDGQTGPNTYKKMIEWLSKQ